MSRYTARAVPRHSERPTTELESVAAIARGDARGRTASLTRLAGPHAGRLHRLDLQLTRVGRDPSVEITVDEGSVSWNHARVLVTDEGVILEDQGSTNGTFVNGEKVSRTRLQFGDQVRFGLNCLMRFALVGEAEERLAKQLYERSRSDELTGAFNRHYLFERLEQELSFSRRQGTTISLILLDLDHFKQVNDRFGHVAGDEVLRVVASRVKSSIRQEDVFGRYGGEEFALIARNDREGAKYLAERLMVRIAVPVPWEGHLIEVTASAGVAVLRGYREATSEALLAAADQQLYRAKSAGRNRVAVAELP